MNKASQASRGVVVPPSLPKKIVDEPLSGYIAIIRIDDDGIKIMPKLPAKPSMNMYALSFDKLYIVDLDEKSVEGTNPRKKVKAFAARSVKEHGFFSKMFSPKQKKIATSLNILYVVEQYHKDLPELMYVTFTKTLNDANAIKMENDVNEKHIELRTSNNRRAIQRGAGKFALALNMIKNQSKNIGNALQKGGKFPDLIGAAKKLVKFTFYLPANGYKAIQNKAKDLCKAMKGGDLKKAQKCCNDIQKMCAKKCNKKQKGGCACKGKCHCKKPGQCGGAFDIHSKVNQEFGKELQRRFNKKADKLKADIKKIQKLKGELKKLPAKDFDNKLKSKKNMSNSQKKKKMIDRQDKKIADKKQAIKEHEQKIYGPLRGGWKNPLKARKERKRKEKEKEKEIEEEKERGNKLFEKIKAMKTDGNYGWDLFESDYKMYGNLWGDWNFTKLNKDYKIINDRLTRGPKLFSQLGAYDPKIRRRKYHSTEIPGFWNIKKMEEDLYNEKLFAKLQSINPKVKRTDYINTWYSGWDTVILEYDLGMPFSSSAENLYYKISWLDKSIEERDYEYRESGKLFWDIEEIKEDLEKMLDRKKEGNKLFAELEKLLLEKLGEKPVLSKYGFNKKRVDYFLEFKKDKPGKSTDYGGIYVNFKWNIKKLKNRIEQLKELKKSQPLMQRSKSLIG